MANPEGYTKEQLKKLNKDIKSQKIEMDSIEHDKWLKEKEDKMEKEMYSSMSSMMPATTSPFKTKKPFGKFSK